MIEIGNGRREGLRRRPWVPGDLTEVIKEYTQRRLAVRPLPGIFEILNQYAAIFVQEILRSKLCFCPPDVYVRPEVREEYNYLRAKENIGAGVEAMTEALPTLYRVLEEKSGGF